MTIVSSLTKTTQKIISEESKQEQEHPFKTPSNHSQPLNRGRCSSIPSYKTPYKNNDKNPLKHAHSAPSCASCGRDAAPDIIYTQYTKFYASTCSLWMEHAHTMDEECNDTPHICRRNSLNGMSQLAWEEARGCMSIRHRGQGVLLPRAPCASPRR